MSKRWDSNTPESACIGKQPFASMADARRAARAVKERGARQRSSQRAAYPYQCRYCGKYHIGRPSPRRRNRGPWSTIHLVFYGDAVDA